MPTRYLTTKGELMGKEIIILEYLKVISTAPVLLTIFAGYCTFKFSEEIKALLSRITQIKLPGGTEIHTPKNKK